MAPVPDPNLELIEEAARRLGPLLGELTLVGGCAARLLVTDPGASPVRPTLDVDLVVEAATYAEYQRFCDRLRGRGFTERTGADAPICRWHHGNLVIDVMPLEEAVLGFSNRWYREAIRNRLRRRLPSGAEVAHIDGPHFLATKLDAFRARGRADYVASADLEDVVIVIDGRASIEREVEGASNELRSHVAAGIAELLGDRMFMEALPGYFPTADEASGRLGALRARLSRLAAR